MRTLGTCRIPVMCTNEDSQSQREDQVQNGKGETERERENYCFTFLMNKHYKRIDIVALL